jgi:hypothetical protein
MTELADLFTARIATVVPDAIGAAAAAEARARFTAAGYTRYALLDRGSYDELRDPDELELVAALITIASDIVERQFSLADTRVLRLVAGDYLLAHHDRITDEGAVELMLDLSSEQVLGAAVHYRRDGDVFFAVPSRPCALSIVGRGPAVTCNHTYVSRLHAGAEVVRLVLLLR